MASRGRTQVRSAFQTDSTKRPTREVFCTGHNRRASCFQARTAANDGRWFYSCPLGKDDKERCKFFKWEDELDSTPVKGPGVGGGNVLGGSASTPSRDKAQARRSRSESEEIDWEVVDTDAIEAQAISVRSTPRVSQISQVPESLEPADGLQARLEAVAGDKRKRGEDESTPKRGGDNPFLHTPGTGTTVFETPAGGKHPALGPLMLAIPEVNEHLLRSDRRVRAAEAMKKSMRQTIKNLQDKVKELEAELARAKSG